MRPQKIGLIGAVVSAVVSEAAVLGLPGDLLELAGPIELIGVDAAEADAAGRSAPAAVAAAPQSCAQAQIENVVGAVKKRGFAPDRRPRRGDVIGGRYGWGPEHPPPRGIWGEGLQGCPHAGP